MIVKKSLKSETETMERKSESESRNERCQEWVKVTEQEGCEQQPCTVGGGWYKEGEITRTSALAAKGRGHGGCGETREAVGAEGQRCRYGSAEP